MSEFFTYSLKNAIALGFFSAIYSCIFLRDMNFRGRRYFLIISVCLSSLLPLISIDFSGITDTALVTRTLNEITVTAREAVTNSSHFALQISDILIFLYLSVAGILFIRLLYQLISIFIKTSQFDAENHNNLTIYHLPLENLSFSFFNLVFIGRTGGEEDMRIVLAHEKVHAMQMHTLDIIILEIISVIFWFNPMVWWYRREIKNVHEFLADEGAITEGFSRKSYQITLLEHFTGSASLTISNNFNYSIIKKRIAMINKEKKDSKKTWKIFLLLPVSLLLILTFSCTEKPETINSLTDQAKGEAAYDTAYYNVDVMPVFPGDFQEIRRFVMQNIRYPEEAKKHAVAGKIFVQFVVDREGNIVTDAKKYKISGEETEIGEVVVVGYKPAEGTDGEGKEEYVQLLKDEAVRVISMLPSFDSPAQKDGKPVPVAFTFPINFALE